MSYITRNKMAAYIDHTNLKANATQKDIKKLCEEAKKYGFASVCILPSRVQLAASLLIGSDVEVCTVCAFPLGNATAEMKAYEASESVKLGADEIDMVINIGAAKDGSWDIIGNEIKAVFSAIKGKTLKVIIETCYLSEDEISTLCEIVEKSGAHYIKTSTGYGSGGATIKNVKQMKVNSRCAKIKAAGGIKTLSTALAMIEAGADRLGTSSGIEILKEIKED